MRRREFIAAISGAIAGPVAGRAQQADTIRRIAVVTTIAQDNPTWAAFRQSLTKLGWSEGRNIRVYHHRPADGVVTKALAEEVVNAMPDVIVVTGTPALRLLHQ